MMLCSCDDKAYGRKLTAFEKCMWRKIKKKSAGMIKVTNAESLQTMQKHSDTV